ncbi:nitric oxide dioxygenase [Pullulanibacillus pueri]|uniref:Flavohemoprotein n=1 Tax=Pullulanibacillus pueri TaxID=1437324 RepID=A0A8J2ZSM7_9BACL|nr:NO-inducible flavohemoprotein [Pullulanibacillus pueri]MBM7680330.1 nitric oxide dioxygenase [Pullulanibacillus pueri]GGH75622.1 flavohemoprotein [Pullulanibacillus pueri]
MLDSKTIETIKSTVPVLEDKGVEITKRFYKLLFENHPELLNIFNHANQKQGRQQTALANAVYQAAKHIDHLENILPAVKQIAHKHRSLGIKPEQYPIVGENLLLAIQQVVGLQADDPIIQAWAEAYGVIADVFINVEKEMYQAAEEQPGGWKGFRNFVVAKKVKESDVITSFYLQAEDRKPIAAYEPGQYISVKVAIPGAEYTQIRQYSLSDSPNKDYYRMSVKKEVGTEVKPDGIISNYLHDFLNEGDLLPLSAPAGDFTLDTNKDIPVVLIAGGVGLTPMISMLNHLSEQYPHRPVTFIQAAKNSQIHAMREHVVKLTQEKNNVRSFFIYDSPTEEDRKRQLYDKEGHIDLDWLHSVIEDKESDFYFCGPVPFMETVNKALQTWGVKEDNIHFEFFGPAISI